MGDLPVTQFFIKLDQDISEDEKDNFHDQLQTVITLSQVHIRCLLIVFTK